MLIQGEDILTEQPAQASSQVVARRAAAFVLSCTVCDAQFDPSVRNVRCGLCGGTLVVSRPQSASSSSASLPRINLGQGRTPTVKLTNVGASIGVARLTAKLEYLAPTGSFKDRGSATLIAAAVEEGVSEFVEDSSGNAGASMAAYAAAVGAKAHIFAPASAAEGKLDQIRVFGARLHVIEGPRQAATDAAVAFAEDYDIPYLSHALSPWFVEGMKSFAEEIMDSEDMPTDIVLPVGNGSLLLAMASVFGPDSQISGERVRVPRLHAVQSDVIHPLVALVKGDTNHLADGAVPKTVASGISVTSPPRLQEMAQAVSGTGGSVVTVGDGAMSDWQRRLASSEGIFCEVTSAAALAGLESLVADGVIESSAKVLVPLTGSGLKEPLRSQT